MATNLNSYRQSTSHQYDDLGFSQSIEASNFLSSRQGPLRQLEIHQYPLTPIGKGIPPHAQKKVLRKGGILLKAGGGLRQSLPVLEKERKIDSSIPPWEIRMSTEDPSDEQGKSRMFDKYLYDKNQKDMSKAINNINNAKWIGKIRTRQEPLSNAKMNTRQSQSSNIFSMQESSKDNFSAFGGSINQELQNNIPKMLIHGRFHDANLGDLTTVNRSTDVKAIKNQKGNQSQMFEGELNVITRSFDNQSVQNTHTNRQVSNFKSNMQTFDSYHKYSQNQLQQPKRYSKIQTHRASNSNLNKLNTDHGEIDLLKDAKLAHDQYMMLKNSNIDRKSLFEGSTNSMVFGDESNSKLLSKKVSKDQIDKATRQIIEDAVSQNSAFGLPSIGGAISTRKKRDQYFNHNIENNGPHSNVKQFMTSKDFKIVKRSNFDFNVQKQMGNYPEYKMDQTLVPNAPLPSSPGAVGLIPDHTNNPMGQDYYKQNLSPDPDMAIPSVLNGIKASRGTKLTHLSNKNYNSQFKTMKTNFKSPMQNKVNVVFNLTGVPQGSQIEPYKPFVEFRNKPKLSPTQKLSKEPIDELPQCQQTPDLEGDISKISYLLGKAVQKEFITPSRNYIEGIGKNLKEKVITSISSKKQVVDDSKYNENDLSGLNQKYYQINHSFENLMSLLTEFQENREQNSIVDQKIEEVAQANGIKDLSNFKEQIQKFFDRRTLSDATKGLAAGGDLCSCKVTQKTMNYLRGEKNSEEHKQHTVCSHHQTEEDTQLQYLAEYKRFLGFTDHLKKELRKDIPRPILIKALARDINKLQNLTSQEKVLFQNEASIERLLMNPELEIVLSIKELDKLKQHMETQVQQTGVKDNKKMFQTGKKLTMKNQSKLMVEDVSEMIIKEAIGKFIQTTSRKYMSDQDRLDKEMKEQMKLHAPKQRLSRRGTFIDMGKLINENLQRKKIEQEKRGQVDQDGLFDNADIENQIEVFRMKLIKENLESNNQYSIQATQEQFMYNQVILQDPDTGAAIQTWPALSKYKFVDTVALKWTEDDHIMHRSQIRELDDKLSENVQKFVEDLIKMRKINYEQEKNQLAIMEPDQPSDNDSEEEYNGMSMLRNMKNQSVISGDEEQEQTQTLFGDFEAQMQFYDQAKKEIIGYNQKPNQESDFFLLCRKLGIIPQPIFKYVSNNTLKYQGKTLGLGYAKALAQFIKKNKKIGNIILKMHLDDCCMKDQELAVILEAVRNSKMGLSLQNFTYSNNQFGKDSIQQLCDLIEFGNMREPKALKQLCLVNVQFKKIQDFRALTQCLEDNMGSIFLQQLKIQSINIGDQQTVNNICNFLHNKETLRINSNLTNLELSGCNLQSKHLLQIADSLRDNRTIRYLDLSGNSVSELVSENQINQGLFIQSLCRHLKYNDKIYSLNLQGLLLGKKLLFFIEQIKNNRSLVQINIINNLLNKNDERQILQKLGIKPRPIESEYDSLLEKYDMCYQLSLSKFKKNHLIQDQGEVQESASMQTRKDEVVSKIINQGIVKNLRGNRNLMEKMNLNSQVGEILASTASKAMDLVSGTNSCDKIYLRRFIGFNEFVFRELGEDVFDQFNFNKPFKWEKCDLKDQSASMVDVNQLQYVMVYIDTENIDDEFTQVKKGSETHEILKNMNGLNYFQKSGRIETARSTESLSVLLEENEGTDFDESVDLSQHEDDLIEREKSINQEAFKIPMIFGTFTNWRVFQMIKTHQFTSIISAATDKERKQLLSKVFDDVNYNLQKDFKNMYLNVYPVLGSVAKMHNAHVVGNLPSDPAQQKCPDYRTFVYSGFVTPGKHSVFIYLPEADQFYQKTIIVDVQERQFIQRVLSREMDVEDHFKTSLGTDLSTCKIQKKDLKLLEAFICDTARGNFQVNEIFSVKPKLINKAMRLLYNNFEHLNSLFVELQSESYDTFPFISLPHLNDFCLKAELIDRQKLEKCIMLSSLKNEEEPTGSGGFTRAQFLKFILWLCQNQHSSSTKFTAQAMDEYLTNKVLPLLKESKHLQIKKELKSDAGLVKFLADNDDTINAFFDKEYFMFSLTLGEAQSLFISKAEIPIQPKNLHKLYVLSKNLVINEQADSHQKYFNFLKDELIELIYRVALHVYDPLSYATNESGACEAPLDVQEMFVASNLIKFQTVLLKILQVSDPWAILIEENNMDQIKAEYEAAGGQHHYEMLKFLPEACREDYLAMAYERDNDQD